MTVLIIYDSFFSIFLSLLCSSSSLLISSLSSYLCHLFSFISSHPISSRLISSYPFHFIPSHLIPFHLIRPEPISPYLISPPYSTPHLNHHAHPRHLNRHPSQKRQFFLKNVDRYLRTTTSVAVVAAAARTPSAHLPFKCQRKDTYQTQVITSKTYKPTSHTRIYRQAAVDTRQLV